MNECNSVRLTVPIENQDIRTTRYPQLWARPARKTYKMNWAERSLLETFGGSSGCAKRAKGYGCPPHFTGTGPLRAWAVSPAVGNPGNWVWLPSRKFTERKQGWQMLWQQSKESCCYFWIGQHSQNLFRWGMLQGADMGLSRGEPVWEAP